MTFNDDARLGRARVSRRGRNTGIALGGGGLGLVAVLLLGQLLGVDLSGFVGGSGAGPEQPGAPLSECRTGADANENLDCRMQGAADSLDAYWSQTVRSYSAPEMVLFEQRVSTGCGGASSATGPFYCPADQSVYVDTSFFAELRSRFGAESGPLAEIYVVAHEWGHHVQSISGIMQSADLRDTGPSSDGVRLELQADCFAGAWARAASTVEDESGTPYLEQITDDQLRQALSAASAVGDDRIQESTTGQVNPETWTHGSSEQRERWFLGGYREGVAECDTFDVPAGRL